MSGDTDKAKISDNQDEDKKSGAGDGQTTEDESSQDSKGESQVPQESTIVPQGNADVGQPDIIQEDKQATSKGDAKSTTANGKDDDASDSKDDKRDLKADSDSKKEENGETLDEDEKDSVKTNDKGGKKAAPKKKPKKEDTEEEDEDEEEEEEEEEDEDDEGDEAEEEEEKKPVKEKVKKPAKKAKDEDEGDDDEGEEEDEEEEEEEEEAAPKPKPKKEPTEPPVPLPAGKGIPLGHISNVEVSLSRFKTQDQKLLHQYLYGQLCLDRNVKRNIKKFKGYEWAIGSSDYKAKLEETTKMEPKQLRTMCEMLDLDKKGSVSDLSARLVGFLQQPTANSPHARGVARAPPAAPPSTPGGRPRRSAAVKVHNRGYSDEEYETDPETKVKGPKPNKEGSEDSDGSFNPSGSEEADSDFDPEAGESAAGVGRKRKSSGRRRSAGKSAPKRGRKLKPGKKGRAAPSKPTRGRRGKSDSEEESEKSESESEQESGSDAQESDEPKSKRGRPAPPVVKGRKGAVAKNANAKATPVKRKPPTPPAKKKAPAGKAVGRPAKKAKKASSEEESGEGSEEEEEGSEEDESGEESDAPVDKKAKRPPTDDEIKKYVKQILEGANLEQITMKTVCKQVYSHYPDFDLAHKKDFIKATVKSCI